MKRETKGGLLQIAVAVLASATIFGTAVAMAEEPVVSGTCTLIRPQSMFTDPIISRDSNMHYFDPIVFPGVYGYFTGGPRPFNTGTHGPAHWHNFAGNVSIDPNGIANPGAATTCTGGFKGNLWSPSLLGYSAIYHDGMMVFPKTFTYSYSGDVPAGFAFIARGALWDCGPGTVQTDVPHLCKTGTVQAVVSFAPALDMTVRTDFGRMQFPFTHLSVGGVPIAAKTPEGKWVAICNDSGNVRCEDEKSFHVDVLFP